MFDFVGYYIDSVNRKKKAACLGKESEASENKSGSAEVISKDMSPYKCPIQLKTSKEHTQTPG